MTRPEYVGADAEVIANPMTGTFEYGKDDVRDVPDFGVFFRDNATCPDYSDAIRHLTQMRRWGQIAASKHDHWYFDTAESVHRPDIHLEAARLLVDEGRTPEDGFPWDTDGDKDPAPAEDIIDGLAYDGRNPTGHLESLAIGLKDVRTVTGAGVEG